MIIKFLSRKSNSAQLIHYALRYILNDEKKDLKLSNSQPSPTEKGFLIRHNIRARTLKGFIREFNENESFRLVRRKDSVRAFHTIISFGTDDRALITDDILKDVAKKYIEERGSNCLYVGSKHEDRGHIHLHLVSSGTQLNGRSARISNQKFRSIKLSMDRHQRENYPFLVNSLPNYDNEKKLTKQALIKTLKANRQTTKATLMEDLEKAFSKSRSQEEFLKQVRSTGLELYSRNGKLQGILHNGKTKFRLSRLGFDPERLHELDLVQSSGERIQSEAQKSSEIGQQNSPQIDQAVEMELGALKAIRTKSEDRENTQDLEITRSFESGDTSNNKSGGNDELLFLPSSMPFLPLPLKKEA